MSLRGMAFSLGLCVFPLVLNSVEACQSALKEIEKAFARSSLQLRTEANLKKAPRLKGRNLHFTTQMELPFIWATDLKRGTDYAIVKKEDHGFGFSMPTVFRYGLLQSDQVFLRSLDFSGFQHQVLATLVHIDPQTGSKSLILRVAQIADPSTGRLSPGSGESLVIQGADEVLDSFVVSPRPYTSEYWITDGSHNIGIVSIDESGNPKFRYFSFPEEVQIGNEHLKITEILKVQFFSDGKRAYIKFKTSDDKTRLAIIWLTKQSTENEKPDDMKAEADTTKAASSVPTEDVKFGIDFGNSVVLAEGANHSSVHLHNPLVFVSYPNRIDVYAANEKLELITSFDVSDLIGGFELDGIEFYWKGQFSNIEDNEGVQRQAFVGEVKAFLRLWDAEKEETRLMWVNVGDPKITN